MRFLHLLEVKFTKYNAEISGSLSIPTKVTDSLKIIPGKNKGD